MNKIKILLDKENNRGTIGNQNKNQAHSHHFTLMTIIIQEMVMLLILICK